jgi:hypothetical protein
MVMGPFMPRASGESELLPSSLAFSFQVSS